MWIYCGSLRRVSFTFARAWLTFAHNFPEGLQVTAAETAVPKAPTTKKKGKKGGAPRQRQVRITNTHLKGEIDLQKDYAAATNPH